MSDEQVDNAHLRTLVVAEAGYAEPTFTQAPVHRLSYSFTDVDAGDGFSAWEQSSVAGETEIAVHSSCASLGGGFRQQALNRFFAKALMLHRPDLIVVCGISGCTLDLPRVAALFSIPCVLYVAKPPPAAFGDDSGTAFWADSSLRKCTGVFSSPEVLAQDGDGLNKLLRKSSKDLSALAEVVAACAALPFHESTFDYSIYELCSRDHPLLMKMQAPDARHFEGLNSVLDVGCGAGLFLDILREQGIGAIGVEQNESIAEYGREMGLQIQTADALAYLSQGDALFEGIYCSHFVEHLPIDAVHELIRLIASRLVDGGLLVLVFPDPESIRSQLLGFWRDPEHVRFYHSELIISIASLMGFEVEWTSYQDQPHAVGYFPETPAPVQMPDSPVPPDARKSTRPSGFIERLFAKLGFVASSRVDQLEVQLDQMRQWHNRFASDHALALEQLEERTQRLWEVNQTWAWNDNVTIKLRKRHGAV